jgi:hypothetical protein
VLAAQVLWALPWRDRSLTPDTPLERTSARPLAPGYRLLVAAGTAIPPATSFAVRTEPPNAEFEAWYYRLGVSLLPGRRALPCATFGGFLPDPVWSGAQYLVVVGPKPAAGAGALMLETPDGSIWRRDPSR